MSKDRKFVIAYAVGVIYLAWLLLNLGPSGLGSAGAPLHWPIVHTFLFGGVGMIGLDWEWRHGK